MARLIFSGEKFRGRVYELILERTTVGRGDHTTLTLRDASVSHSHCEILVFRDEVIVRDLDSRNGTFVRGVCLHKQQRQLHQGDEVRFGDVAARLEMDESADRAATEDFTAVHEHARYLREREQSKSTSPVEASLELGATPEAAALDHTVMMPAPAQDRPAARPDAASPGPNQEGSTRRFPWGFIVPVALLGLVFVLWLLFRNP